MASRRLRYALVVLGLAATFCYAAPGIAPAAEALTYTTELRAADLPDDVRERVAEASTLIGGEETPPETPAGLQRRVADDRATLLDVLRAEGYHDAEITIEVGSGDPTTVTIAIEPGSRYRFGDLNVAPAGAHRPTTALTFNRADLGLERDAPARAAAVIEAETKLVSALGERGHPFATIADRRVLVDHAAQTVRVELNVDIGPAARFGALEVSGLDRVEPAFIRRRITWQVGEVYDARVLARFRRALIDSGLFESVAAKPAAQPNPDGMTAIELRVTERKRRTIAAGISYSTAEGPAANLSWTHRNLFGEGERLQITLEGGQIAQGAKIDYRIPDVLGVDQAFAADARFAREQTDAFDAVNFGAGARLERTFGRYLSGSAGIGFDHLEVEQNNVTRTFELISLPLILRWDSSDDLLDPTEGARVELRVTPTADVSGSDSRYVKSELTASTYVDLTDDGWAVLAGRTRLGVIAGAATADVPAARRFFAGGGGSVRGYGFQDVGPLDAGSDPLGGRSVVEVGLEARLRITEDIGVVPFIDGGMVYDDATPQFDQELLWGAGIGFRYYTAIGPIRLDIATPLNGRSTDDDFQFYISIGQAF